MIGDGSGSGRAGGVQEPLPQQLGEHEARCAIELAQYGRVAQASGMLLELRARHPMGQSARMAVWLLTLEAVLLQRARRNPEALDRMHRASVLAVASANPDLAAEAAVWLLSLDAYSDKPQRLPDAFALAFRGFERLGDSARARLCLVLADAHQGLGQFEAAAPWYRRARAFSRRAGARPLMAAIELHRIASALQRLQLERMAGLVPSEVTGKDWLEDIRSSQRLHLGLGVAAPDEGLLMAEARAHQLRDDFAAAARALQAALQACPADGVHDETAQLPDSTDRAQRPEQAALRLERAWCRVRAGQVAAVAAEPLPPDPALAGWPPAARVVALRQLLDIRQALAAPAAAPAPGPLWAQALKDLRDAEAQSLPILAACQAHAARADHLLGAP